jgi:hypothetical protein
VLIYANDTAADSNSSAKSATKSSSTATSSSAVTSMAASLSASKKQTLHLPRMNSSVIDIHSDGFADDVADDVALDTTSNTTSSTGVVNVSTKERRQLVQQLFEAIDACDALRVRELLHRGCEVNTVWLPQPTNAVIDDATNAR